MNEDWLFDTEREQNALNYHILLCQDGQTPAGGALTAALIDGERHLDRGRLAVIRAKYAHLRMLSMLRYFLGRDSVRDLSLPMAPPWVVPFVVAKNLVLATLGLTEPGRRYLDQATARFREQRSQMLFKDENPDVGPLSV